jgi:hypothetical protein
MKGKANCAEARWSEGGLGCAQFRYNTPQLAAGELHYKYDILNSFV